MAIDASIVISDDLKARFWAKVDKRGPDDCWSWTGFALKRNGRGLMPYKNKNFTAPRISLAIKLGRPIAEGMWALHTCDNPNCVNPNHLWEGNRKDNMTDCASKGRMHRQGTPFCIHGHPYTPENTYTSPTGYKICRECRKVHWDKYKSRKASEMALTTAQENKILAIGDGRPSDFTLHGSGFFLIKNGYAFINELGARHLTDKGHAERRRILEARAFLGQQEQRT